MSHRGRDDRSMQSCDLALAPVERYEEEMSESGSPFRESSFDRGLAMLEREGVSRRVLEHLRDRWGVVLGKKTEEDVARLLRRAILLTCPRCAGLIPSEERMGEYCGASSRTDRKPGPATEICSQCGAEEADVWHLAEGDKMAALRGDRARWLLPEVAHPLSFDD